MHIFTTIAIQLSFPKCYLKRSRIFSATLSACEYLRCVSFFIFFKGCECLCVKGILNYLPHYIDARLYIKLQTIRIIANYTYHRITVQSYIHIIANYTYHRIANYTYRVAKTHRIPYLYTSFSAKVTYI